MTAPYRSMPHQGRRDYRRTGRRYRWACRLWRHAPPLHFAAAACFVNAGRIAGTIRDKADEMSVRAFLEMGESYDAMVRPRFAREL